MPASVRGERLFFTIDTGSYTTFIEHSFVSPELIEPCALKEMPYLSHTVKIMGRARLTVALGNSSLEIQHRFYVAESTPGFYRNLVGMDFLTDFQCVLDVEPELKITMNLTAKAPLPRYRRPYMNLNLKSDQGKVF